MDDSTQLPPAPGTTTPPDDAATVAQPATGQPAAKRTWRDRLPSGREAVAAGAVVAGLAIDGAGFGAGYAVGDDGASTGTSQTSDTDWGDRGLPGDPHGPMGDMDGTTGQAPDFDGDGQPDTGSGSDSDSGSTSDSSSTQQS